MSPNSKPEKSAFIVVAAFAPRHTHRAVVCIALYNEESKLLQEHFEIYENKIHWEASCQGVQLAIKMFGMHAKRIICDSPTAVRLLRERSQDRHHRLQTVDAKSVPLSFIATKNAAKELAHK